MSGYRSCNRNVTVCVIQVLAHAEVYNVTQDQWYSVGDPMNYLKNELGEMGAQVLRPDGTVFVIGANGRTSIYNTNTKSWTKGPTFPPTPSGDPCTVRYGRRLLTLFYRGCL